MTVNVHISERSAYGHDEWHDHPFETVEEATAFAEEWAVDIEGSDFNYDSRGFWVRYNTETDFPAFVTIGVYVDDEPVVWHTRD